MALRRDNKTGIWHISLTVNGRRLNRSTGTVSRTDAKKLHDKIAAEAWRMKHGIPGAYRWEDACVVYLQGKRGKKTYHEDVQKLMRLQLKFKRKLLPQLTPAVIDQGIDDERKLSPATRNRYRVVAQAVLRAARDNDMIQHAPKLKLEREPAERVRWLTKPEANRLLEELGKESSELELAATFALATGLRLGNVLGLKWNMISYDLKRAEIPASDMKTGKPLIVPLNDVARGILLGQMNEPQVFNLKEIARGPWERALQRAGIKNFRWHDLRHTWATWHVQAGTPLEVLMKLGGWSSYRCVLKYAHFSPDFTAKFANNVSLEEKKDV